MTELVVGSIGVSIGLYGLVPYLKSTFSGSTRPHPLTWFIWSVQGVLFCMVYGKGAAGAKGVYCFLFAMARIIVFAVSIREMTQEDWRKLAGHAVMIPDRLRALRFSRVLRAIRSGELWHSEVFRNVIAITGSAVGAIALFGFQDPAVSLVLLLLIDIFGFIPTVERAWKNPKCEKPLAWFLFMISGAVMLLSNVKFTWQQATFPVWVIVTGLVILFCVFKSSIPVISGMLKKQEQLEAERAP